MEHRTHFALAMLFCVTFFLPAGLAQQEQWLQYRSAREAGEIVGDSGWVEVKLSGERPEEVEMPEFKADDPLFGKWATPMVENGYLWIALDRSRKVGVFDLVLIDSNGDGRLADETAVESYRIDYSSAYIGPVKVVFQIEDGPASYHLNFQFHWKSEDDAQLYVSGGGWYEGTIEVGGAKKHCVLVDHNVNGTFDDKSLEAEQCDRIQIGETTSQDMRFVGNFIEVDDVLYRPQIARDGAFVTIARAGDVTFGKVRVHEAITEFSAGGENGLLKVRPEGGVGSLPVGKYHVNDWTIERKDDAGAQWVVRAGMFPDDKVLFDVSENQQAELSIGEPLVATLTASGDKRAHAFRHQLRGKNGERIELTRDGSQPPAPKLHIRSKDGAYDRTYSFAYG